MAVVDEHAAKNQNQRPLYITVSSALDDLGAPFLTGRTPFWRRGGASFFGPRPLGVFLTATSLCRMYIHVRPHKDRLGNEPMVRPVPAASWANAAAAPVAAYQYVQRIRQRSDAAQRIGRLPPSSAPPFYPPIWPVTPVEIARQCAHGDDEARQSPPPLPWLKPAPPGRHITIPWRNGLDWIWPRPWGLHIRLRLTRVGLPAR